MGNLQAVLEFDEEIQAPWRPRLVLVTDAPDGARRTTVAHPSRRSPSRVGVCRPPQPARPRQQPGHRPGAETAARRPVTRPAPRRESAPLRLTRRARRLVVVLGMGLAVALGSWLGSVVDGDGAELRLAGESSVVVQPGDTLWSIASSVAGDADVREVVDEIQALNSLGGADLTPGQTLLLP
jgi:nucleoid-associated protein YgaU